MNTLLQHAVSAALLGLVLSLSAGAASAGVIYSYSTQLELLSGVDTDGLDGARVSFTAEFADGAVWEFDPLFGFPIAVAQSHLWSVSGSGAVDGDYTSSTGEVSFEFIVWQQAPNEFITGIANFSGLFIHNLATGLAIGSPVRPENFGELVAPELLIPSLRYWETSDGSRYNFFNNASVSVFERAAIPIPSAFWLLGIALAGPVSSHLRLSGNLRRTMNACAS